MSLTFPPSICFSTLGCKGGTEKDIDNWQLKPLAGDPGTYSFSQSTSLKLHHWQHWSADWFHHTLLVDWLHTVQNVQKQNMHFSTIGETITIAAFFLRITESMWNMPFILLYFSGKSEIQSSFFLNKSSDLSEQRDLLLKNNKPFIVLAGCSDDRHSKYNINLSDECF